MNRTTLNNDLAQVWRVIDSMQTLHFEPGRVLYRAALQNAGGSAVVSADVQAVINTEDLTVFVPGIAADDTDDAVATVVAQHIFTVLSALRDDDGATERTLNLFARLAEVTLPVPVGLSQARIEQQAQRGRLGTMLNMAAFYQLAYVVVEHDYQDKDSAHTARQRLVNIGLVLQRRLSVNDDLTLYELVSQIIANVGMAYQGFTDTLRPVGYLTPRQDMSALALCWNLYQDMDWIDDLVARNVHAADAFLRLPVEYRAP